MRLHSSKGHFDFQLHVHEPAAFRTLVDDAYEAILDDAVLSNAELPPALAVVSN